MERLTGSMRQQIGRLWVPLLAVGLPILAVVVLLRVEGVAIRLGSTPDAPLRPVPPAFLEQEPRVSSMIAFDGYQLTYEPATERAPKLVLRAFTAPGRVEPAATPVWVEYWSGNRRWHAANWTCNSVTWSAEVSWEKPVTHDVRQEQLDLTRSSLEELCEPR